MNKKEFIEKLRRELSKLPSEEIEAATAYYEEYFDEAGTEDEADLIEELGSPKKVAAQIKVEYAARKLDDNAKPSVRGRASAVWWVILGICSAPVSIPLAISLFVCAICLVGCVLIFGIALLAGVLGGIIAGIAAVVIGVMAVPEAISTAVMFIGMGLAAVAICAILAIAVIAGMRGFMRLITGVLRKKLPKKKKPQYHVDSCECRRHEADEEARTEFKAPEAGKPTGNPAEKAPKVGEPAGGTEKKTVWKTPKTGAVTENPEEKVEKKSEGNTEGKREEEI